MQYLITPFSTKQEKWAWYDEVFTDQELDILQFNAFKAETPARVGGGVGGSVNDSIRRSNLMWVDCTIETEWVFKKLSHVVSIANSKFFRFDLDGFGEPLQFTNYNSDVAGTYDWHIDINEQGPSRKLSLVVQLSHPNDYEGGELELQTSGREVEKIKKKRGLIVFFPSWTIHRVTPVTRGSRQTIVSWITGPAFR